MQHYDMRLLIGHLCCAGLAFFFADSSFAESRPLVPSHLAEGLNKQSNSTATKTQPSKEAQGEGIGPTVVKNIELQKNLADHAQDAKEREAKAANERGMLVWTTILGLATIILALIAIGQLFMFWHQLKLMRTNAEDGKNVATAALASAEAAKATSLTNHAAFVASNRPLLKIRSIEPVPNPTDEGVIFNYEIVNLGNTNAKIVSISHKVLITDGAELPPLPSYGKAETMSLDVRPGYHKRNYPLVGKDATEYLFATERGKHHAGLDATNPLVKDVYFLGYIEYRDIDERLRRTAFLRLLDYKTMGFVYLEKDEYEYQD